MSTVFCAASAHIMIVSTLKFEAGASPIEADCVLCVV